MAGSGRRQRVAVAGASGLIGSHVVELATAAGHEVVPLSRNHGVDLTRPQGLSDRLSGVDAIIDVTRPATMDEGAATDFFTTVAVNLGRAARQAGVPRTVVLSIVGIEQGQDFPWYRVTLAHERAVREHAPGVRVLRATQFHEFPGQVLQRSGDGDTARIMDMPTQPVASAEVAAVLLEMATADEGGDRQIAGPSPEQLVDLVTRWCELRGDDVQVLPVPATPQVGAGSALPGPDVERRGPDWWTWAQASGRP
ncbi:SDR family oxidoreductase [Janibacter alittae]|uniref:NAD(P)H-binding protein n=1 Tax=Janibacter alittae TaxID=3115209 RepID=A0ABZ2MFM8_9MICO